MEAGILDSAVQALVILADPLRLSVLATGVVLGLILGILPGIGGLAGTALLLPFTFAMDPYMAFAFLLGLAATTSTGDPIPAVLFGVPGGAGSAATVLDGLPMTKRGEAGRALSAAYMSSLMGGLFGAALLGFSIPFIRPLILHIGSPELLALSIFGISMVAILSGNTPLRGLAMACLGIMLAMIGSDPQTGTLRWTMNTFYLFDGMPLVPLVLGLFALPELCDLMISRSSLAGKARASISTGMMRGAQDVFSNWWLVLRCSWIGAAFGALPGIGASVIDWLAYGHAIRSEKGARETFGKGDVRGVIASESANNAKEGGALIPTIAFGVPGSAGMAILLGAFMIHGLVPGPDMLTKHLDITYSMVWTIAIANILGAGLCYAFSGQFARLATLRYTLILPVVLCIIYIGAFEGSRSWGDLYMLLAFGVLGWIMKRLRWPRPPLILGFVLGEIIERYMFISIERYGIDWLTRPFVILIFAVAILSLFRPFIQDVRERGGFRSMVGGVSLLPRLRLPDIFYVVLMGAAIILMMQASQWNFSARLVPMVIGSLLLVFTGIGLMHRLFMQPVQASGDAHDDSGYMDVVADDAGIPSHLVVVRAIRFFGWLLAFMASMALIGLIPTVPLFIVAFMRFENREPWRLVLPQAVICTLFIYVLFDWMLAIPWPQSWLGMWAPELRIIPSV